MNKYVLLTLLTGMITLFILCCHSDTNSNEEPQTKVDSLKRNCELYKFHQSYSGGGGFITGIIQDPMHPEIIYARCDVAGMFKSLNAGKDWFAINNGMSAAHHHCVHSFTISEHNTNILFRCSGDARRYNTFGTIHKSTDAGKNWKLVCEKVDFNGNGSTRMYGELIDIDPFNPDFVVAGGYSNGVWISRDMGEEWTYSGLKGERIGCLAFHPYMENRIYVGTISDAGLFGAKYLNDEKLKSYIRQHHDFPRGRTGRLYLSEDHGRTWNLLLEKENLGICELAFDMVDKNILLMACQEEGVFKSTDSGYSFIKCMNGLPKGKLYGTICSSPKSPGTYYTALRTPDIIENNAPIPIYVSYDTGKSWKLINEHDMKDMNQYPGYMNSVQKCGWAISKVRVDHNIPQKLYFSNWYGVSTSINGGHTWNGHFFCGLETNCLENIQCDPSFNGHVYYTVADHSPGMSRNNGVTYNHLPKIKVYNASSALVRSKWDTSLLIYGAINRSSKYASIVKVLDQGKNMKPVLKLDSGSFVQVLKEDYFQKGKFWAYIDGSLKKDAGLYYSIDWGETWQKCKLPFPSEMLTLPHHKYFIEAELLSIAVYQVKNVCGTNKLLEPDPFNKNTIYFGEPTEGIFKSVDGGSNWTVIKKNLPFQQDTSSVLNVLKADHNRAGWLYAGFIREGLWLSKNYGSNWEKVFPHEDSIFNVSDMTLCEEQIFIVCESLYWSNCPSGVYYSENLGKSWMDISDPELGAIRWKGIDIDMVTGRLHLASSGNGCFYADRREH